MSKITLNTELAAQKIAQNLGLEDLNQVNDIKVIVQGFHEEAEIVADYVDSTVENMYIQSASETYLDIIGSQEGIYRVKDYSVRLRKEEEAIFIQITADDFIGDVLNLNEVIIPRGYNLELTNNNLIIVFEDEIDLSILQENERLFINCTIKSIDSSSVALISDTVFTVSTLPLSFKNQLKSIQVGLKKDINIQVIEESLSNYRDRLIYAKSVPKYSTESAVRIAISSNALVHQYIINYDVYPYEITLFNQSFLYSDEYRTLLENYAISQISTQIDMRKSDGTVYDILLAKAVNFSLELRDQEDKIIEIDEVDFKEYLARQYVLGNITIIDLNFLQKYLVSTGSNVLIRSLQIYKYIDSFKFLSKDNSIIIHETEYPFYELNTNGLVLST